MLYVLILNHCRLLLENVESPSEYGNAETPMANHQESMI